MLQILSIHFNYLFLLLLISLETLVGKVDLGPQAMFTIYRGDSRIEGVWFREVSL